MYNTYWIISILSNLQFAKDFLNMDQGWGAFIERRISFLFPLEGLHNADSLEIENQTEGQDKIRICLVNEIRKPGLLLENSICRTNCGENLFEAVLKYLFSPSRIVHVFFGMHQPK